MEKIIAETVLNVLLLEDSVRDFEIISENLIDAGYHLNITCVDTEVEFITSIRSNKLDVILSDFKLPGFDAFGALRLRNDICPDVPFICVSGSIGEETAIELIKQGAADYILKDRLARLPFAIKRALEEAKAQEAQRQAEEKLLLTLENLRKSFGTIIKVMVSAVEMKDPYTAGHQLRTADLARAIATEIGLAEERIDGIRMAGSIHDIGKLSVPSEILTKPAKLTVIEFSLIKEHAQNGYEMLKDVESPWPLAQIVYQHHERINGSGYPRNLKGDEIILEARIMAVADVVEAMASHRPYRAALGIDAALEEIEKNRETLFDSAVVDACLRLFREKGYQFAKKFIF